VLGEAKIASHSTHNELNKAQNNNHLEFRALICIRLGTTKEPPRRENEQPDDNDQEEDVIRSGLVHLPDAIMLIKSLDLMLAFTCASSPARREIISGVFCKLGLAAARDRCSLYARAEFQCATSILH